MKKFIAIILTFVTLIGIVPFQTAFAADAGDTLNFSLSHYAKEKGTGSLYEIPKGNGIEFVDPYDGHHTSGAWCDVGVYMGTGGVYAYCIQKGTAFYSGNRTGTDPDKNSAFQALSDDAQTGIKLALLYGFPNRSVSTLGAPHADDAYVATQAIVWEYQLGFRTNPTSRISSITKGGYTYSGNQIYNKLISGTPAESAYNKILDDMAAHLKAPSFTSKFVSSATTTKLTYNSSNGKYQATVTDSNSSGANLEVVGTNTTDVSISRSGNTYTITANSPKDGTFALTLKRSNAPNATTGSFLIWGNLANENQIVATGATDPISLYMKVDIEMTGDMKIIKTSKNNDGKVEGFEFEVKKSDGTLIGTYKSKADGTIDIKNLLAGNYTVREINLSDEFVQPTPNPVSVEIKAGQTATVNFNNIKKMGVIQLGKTNANPIMGDYSLKGATFDVKNANGVVVDTITTAEDGTGQSKPLPLGTYTVYETKAPYGFVRDKNIYTRTLSGSLGTAEIVYCPKVTIPERPQTGQVKITKLDAETAATAQGDATLSGAVFSLLDKDGKEVERLYCGDKTTVTSKEVPLGNYTVKEVVPPKGYTLTQKEYPVKIEYSNDLVEVNLISSDVSNTVIKGKVAIVKHSDEADPNVSPENPQVEKPLEGAVFEVYLKSAGSYANAKQAEKDKITTDENGYAMTKFLPYGTYVVKEVVTPEGQKTVKPFDVFISTDQKTYPYILNDPTITAPVKIEKRDAETNKLIPIAGVQFRVKDLSTGAWVKQSFMYPTPTTIEIYETAPDGTLVMPENLRYGKYELHEVKSPYGYVLSKTAIPFEIKDPSGDMVTVTMKNMPVKGKVTVEKLGELLTNATFTESEYGDVFTPSYEVRGIKGAKFNIIAATDIITPDGTVRAKKGDIVDTVTTGTNGKATSKELYLGDYYAVEIAVPEGFVIDETPILFSLEYVDQNTPLVSAEISQYNERVKADINLVKHAEQFYVEKSGKTEFVYEPIAGYVFGLFAKSDIKNADGKVIIPADSLMDILITDTDGKAISSCDISIADYYVKELKSDDMHIPLDTVYDAPFVYKDDKTLHISISINDGEPILNDMIKGKIKIVKTTEDGETPLAGVQFIIRDKDRMVVANLFTDENGLAETGLLPKGQYTIKEVETQESYVLDEHEHFVSIEKHGDVATFGLINEKIKGQIQIIKTDGKTRFPLEGVVFEVRDADGNVIAELTTDKDGKAITEELVYGKYTVVEKSTLTEYILNDEPQEVFIKEHKKVVDLEMQNTKISGKIKVYKTDGKTKTPLDGVVFEVFDKDGKIVSTITTDKDGIAITEDLDYGDYTIKEHTAKEGYVLDETVHEIQIREHEKVYELNLTNNKIPEQPKTPDTPKTGDDSNMSLWLAIMGVAVLGMAVLGFVGFRKKKKQGTEE